MNIIVTIILLDLPFFLNYDCVFRSYDCVFHDKIILLVQHNLQLFVEELQCYHFYTNSVFFSVRRKLLCNRPNIPYFKHCKANNPDSVQAKLYLT